MDVDLGLASPRHDFALCTLDYDIFFLHPLPPFIWRQCNKKKKLHSDVSINFFYFVSWILVALVILKVLRYYRIITHTS